MTPPQSPTVLQEAIIARSTGLKPADIEEIKYALKKAGATDEQITEAIKTKANLITPPGENKG